jgi:hypothetical protein
VQQGVQHGSQQGESARAELVNVINENMPTIAKENRIRFISSLPFENV